MLQLIKKFSQNNRKLPEFFPYLKLAIQHQSKVIDQFQFYQYFQKFTNVLFLISFAPLQKHKTFTIINQSGFHKGHSTNTLLLKLRDDIRTAMNWSEVTLSILIDYSKVFDTTDHHILHEKLQNMNFPKNTINIICSHLIERYQLCTNGGQEINLITCFLEYLRELYYSVANSDRPSVIVNYFGVLVDQNRCRFLKMTKHN